jgi:drug/metabolite transporter (DMT)-like permease
VETTYKSTVPTLAGLIAIVLWSGTFALARSLSEKLGPLTTGAAVYCTGTIFCIALSLVSRAPANTSSPKPRISWKYLLGCGLLFTVYTLVIYLAVGLARDRTELLEIALINYLWPAGTVVLSLPLLRQRASFILWPATLIALAGIFLVMTHEAAVSWGAFRSHVSENPIAFGLALTGAISWALYSNLARRWTHPNSPGGVVFFMGAAALLLLGARVLSPETSKWGPQAFLEVLALGGITATAYALWDVAMRKGNLNLVAAASYATPLLSTLVSFLYLRVTPGSRVWAGSVLIVVGSLISWRAIIPRAEDTRPI